MAQEKEIISKEKNQSNNGKDPSPVEGHRLQYSYCIWYSRRTPGKLTNAQTYDQNLRIVTTFSTVEQFWSVQSYLYRPSELAGHSDLHLFKDGIKPMWEVSKSVFYSLS